MPNPVLTTLEEPAMTEPGPATEVPDIAEVPPPDTPTPALSPAEEIERLRGEIAQRDEEIERLEGERDEALEEVDQLEDTADEAKALVAMLLTELDRSFGIRHLPVRFRLQIEEACLRLGAGKPWA